jgi:Ni,Fe-hydrogenase III large subunit/NADH:ubiquinone oxidoreductase subunit C
MMNKFITVKNNQKIRIDDIPSVSYEDFKELNTSFLEDTANHCVNYFGYPQKDGLQLFCCIANDENKSIYISSSIITETGKQYDSFTSKNMAFHLFEREISENFGIKYSDHPWLKPVRYSHDRHNKSNEISNYPFYEIKSEELHEVGVGPIHAGIIEPGHFRFICNGEKILHLEIQLGYQHRGIEKLFLEKKNLNQLTILAESISGDTTVGHTACFANLWESLCGYGTDEELHFTRTLALELERLAVHTGDLSAICGDIAYQIGSAVFSKLRTPIINFFQSWCGNRLAKGLIRCCKNYYPLTHELADKLTETFDKYEFDFNKVNGLLANRPGALNRFLKTGVVTYNDMVSIGAVGMTARNCGLMRDIRATHPNNYYANIEHKPILKHHGDVHSRAQIRREEIIQSLGYIRGMLKNIPQCTSEKEIKLGLPKPESFVLSLVEGWRGEICHCAITDGKGDLSLYKIKDPSFHNWLALALAVRNNEISDFPICNKSFNLSYCGNDL